MQTSVIHDLFDVFSSAAPSRAWHRTRRLERSPVPPTRRPGAAQPGSRYPHGP